MCSLACDYSDLMFYLMIKIQLMVATTLVLLCSKPLEVAFFGVVPWILSVPAIAIIGREVIAK